MDAPIASMVAYDSVITCQISMIQLGRFLCCLAVADPGISKPGGGGGGPGAVEFLGLS